MNLCEPGPYHLCLTPGNISLMRKLLFIKIILFVYFRLSYYLLSVHALDMAVRKCPLFTPTGGTESTTLNLFW